MPQPKGSNGQTPRTKRELAALELIDQADDHGEVFAALAAVDRATAHARRRIGAAQKRTVKAYTLVTTAQADEDNGPEPTPLAEIIQFPGRRRPQPPTAPMAAVAA